MPGRVRAVPFQLVVRPLAEVAGWRNLNGKKQSNNCSDDEARAYKVPVSLPSVPSGVENAVNRGDGLF
jgi:hypothetical protein